MKRSLFYLMGILIVNFGFAQNIQYVNNALKQYSGTLNTGDARYIGMGGSMGALGANASAMEQNPAGLGLSISSEVNLTLGINSISNESNFGGTRSADETNFNLSQFGALFSFPTEDKDWKQVTLGINYTSENLDQATVLGRNNQIQFDDVSDPDNIIEDVFTFNGYVDELDGYKQKVSIGVGTNYKDRLYLGLSTNLHYTEFRNNIIYSEEDEVNNIITNYDQVNTPYFERGSGFSLGVGAVGKVTDNLRLGAAYHSPVWYDFIEEEFWASDDQGFFLALSDYGLTTSGRFVGSAGIVVAKRLALNFDYTYHMNGSLKLKPSGNFSEANTFIDDAIKNTSEFRVGGEFRFKDLYLRGGFNFVESPYEELVAVGSTILVNENNQQINSSISEAFIGDITRISAGIGYDFGNFKLDFAYQNQSQDFNYIFGGTDYVNPSNSNSVINLSDTYVSSVEQSSNLFLLTAGWNF